METVMFALLFGAALWLVDLYNASKFSFFYPDLKADLLPRGAARWKRVWVFRNQLLKHVGLFLVWTGVTLGTHFSHKVDAADGRVFYVVGFLGFVLYLASRLWPTFVEKRPRGEEALKQHPDALATWVDITPKRVVSFQPQLMIDSVEAGVRVLSASTPAPPRIAARACLATLLLARACAGMRF